MPKSKGQGRSKSTSKIATVGNRLERKEKDKPISARTKKQIDTLPEHAQNIYKKTHASALEQYQNPEKRRGGKRESAEQVAHKAAWAAVKKHYKKQGNEWLKKEEAD
ncbi:MAG TPA: ChaB family protein [Nitrososphaeraceae archaeon]|jgi:cation transport regulator